MLRVSIKPINKAALAHLMECQDYAVKREQTAGEARKVQANSFKFINQIVRKILSL